MSLLHNNNDKKNKTKRKKLKPTYTFPQRKAAFIKGDNSFDGKHYIH